ncbi:MAG: response regulator [candidate division KSB1 bacterium]|nr:response regulator [candidate division KSB1 bacterium]MDZ7335543.1 response regulator [candidate division KSB1 bacterium]MDZ7356909.1 response regulator [candidate division KSB1 bacterium]MDZ7399260.1 response regulator [candidate division KSB1 bacterium]
MEKTKKRIIVIDDDPVMRLSCFKILDKEGYLVETYEDGEQGLAAIHRQRPDLLVVDLKMPKIGGMEVISRVHQVDPDICIVVITGYATIGTAVDAMKAGAYDFLPKPFTPDELRLIIKRGIERSELAEQSRRLKQEKEHLQRRFLTFVSHQLQSPLVAIHQYLEVLKHLEDSPEKHTIQREWIDRSIVRLKELIAIIQDWLTIAKIESGQFVQCLEPVKLKPIIDDLVLCYSDQAKEQQVMIHGDISDDLPAVKGHEQCLRMLFSNLIVNAIKYNKRPGEVHLTARVDPDYVIVSVRDTGIGIPQDKLELIFEEFYRVRDESTKNISGTGLGLPICKKIVDEIGGQLEVESVVNQGSCFHVYLPKQKD